jgi:hypothetical protein
LAFRIVNGNGIVRGNGNFSGQPAHCDGWGLLTTRSQP